MSTDTPIESPAASPRLGMVEVLLAAAWILLPAVQYLGSYERTRAVVARQSPSGALASLDLSPWYVVLLGLTLVYVTITVLHGRSLRQKGNGPW